MPTPKLSNSIESIFERLEDYGKNTLAVVVDPIHSKFTSIAIVQCDELCNLDGGRELFRFHRCDKMPSLTLHGNKISPELILTTPNCKKLAEKIAKQHAPCPIQMLFD